MVNQAGTSDETRTRLQWFCGLTPVQIGVNTPIETTVNMLIYKCFIDIERCQHSKFPLLISNIKQMI